MADEEASVKTGEEAANDQGGEEKDQSGADAKQSTKSDAGNAGAGAETPPRRNADYWEREQQREKDRQARANFFKSKKPKQEDEDGDEDQEEQPLTRAEVKEMLDGNKRETESRERETRDEIAINAFLSNPDNEGFKKYESKAKAFLKAHPYVPIETAFYHYAYPDAKVEGARLGAKAEDRTKRKSITGDTRRPAASGGFPDMSGKTPAERGAALKDFRGKMRRGQANLTPDSDE